jgi:hypothetical protein
LKKYFLFTLLFAGLAATAQEKVHHQTLHWLYYQNQLSFSEHVYWVNILENRRFIHPDAQNQFIVHSRLHYRKGKWDFGAGFAVSSIYNQLPEVKSNNVATEIRPVAEVNHDQPVGKISIQNRIRFDNRFLEANNAQSVFDTSMFVLRFRYRLQAKIPVLKNKEGKSILILRLANEIMLNHKENLFDQNRFHVAFDYVVNKHFTIDAGYIYIYQQRFNRDEFYSRNVIRIGIQHKIFLK